MNVFFPNVGRRCELVDAFRHALPKISPGIVWGSDPDYTAAGLNAVDRIITLPDDFASSEFLDELLVFLNQDKIDLIIPTIDPDLVRYSGWRDRITADAPHTTLLLSPTSVIECVSNKSRSREAFKTLGAVVPTPVLNPSEADLPFFIKPAEGSASIGARAVYSKAEMDAALVDTQDPVIERIVGGDEITVDVLLDLQGVAISAVPRRRLKVRGGEVMKAVIERDEALETAAMNLAEGLGCRGPVTVQYRNPAPGEWVAMEVNARLGGGVPLTIAAGADWPDAIIRMVIGQDASTINCSVSNSNLLMTRYDQGFFLDKSGVDGRAPSSLLALPELIVLDMDDTLYPEASFVRNCYRAVAQIVWQDYGIEIEADLNWKFNQGLRGDLFTSVLLDHGIEVDETYVARHLVAAYQNHKPDIKPYLDVVPFLSQAKQQGHKIALLSDGWETVQKNKFAALGLSRFFDEVLFTDSLGRDHWKPSPKPFLEILSRFDVSAENAMYVGDNPEKDFVAPNALGMVTVRIRRKGTEHMFSGAVDAEATATFDISSFAELQCLARSD